MLIDESTVPPGILVSICQFGHLRVGQAAVGAFVSAIEFPFWKVVVLDRPGTPWKPSTTIATKLKNRIGLPITGQH